MLILVSRVSENIFKLKVKGQQYTFDLVERAAMDSYQLMCCDDRLVPHGNAISSQLRMVGGYHGLCSVIFASLNIIKIPFKTKDILTLVDQVLTDNPSTNYIPRKFLAHLNRVPDQYKLTLDQASFLESLPSHSNDLDIANSPEIILVIHGARSSTGYGIGSNGNQIGTYIVNGSEIGLLFHKMATVLAEEIQKPKKMFINALRDMSALHTQNFFMEYASDLPIYVIDSRNSVKPEIIPAPTMQEIGLLDPYVLYPNLFEL